MRSEKVKGFGLGYLVGGEGLGLEFGFLDFSFYVFFIGREWYILENLWWLFYLENILIELKIFLKSIVSEFYLFGDKLVVVIKCWIFIILDEFFCGK